jgi:hypothetical protein
MTSDEQVYMLRCDLYDAIGLPAGPFDSFYVVAALGPHEQKSSYCSMNEGVVHFESSSPGKEGYYEQLEDIKVGVPSDCHLIAIDCSSRISRYSDCHRIAI